MTATGDVAPVAPKLHGVARAHSRRKSHRELHCGATYAMSREKVPGKDEDTAFCERSGRELLLWRGKYVCTLRLIKT
jgi:hypothetical protein